MGNDLFEKQPLENLVNIYDSQRKPVKKADRKPGKYPYYGASGIADYVDSYIFDGEYLLLAEDGENLKTKNTPIAFMANGKFWVNNHAHILQGNKTGHTKFLCYALQIANIDNYLSGSTRPKLTQGDMKKIRVFSPSLTQQVEIAKILDSFEKKIELNNQMNQTLESMAQALFKSWFVDFDPVIDNALASGKNMPKELEKKAEIRKSPGKERKELPEDIKRLFPDEFEFSDELGWIPKGWSNQSLSKVATLITKSVNPNKEPDKLWSHFSIPAFDEEKSPKPEYGETIKSSKYIVPDNSVLASKLNPQFPRIWLPDTIRFENSICSTEFMPFVPIKEYNLPYLYTLLSSEQAQSAIKSRTTGSTGSRQRVKPKEIAQIPILFSSNDLMKTFSSLCKNYFFKIHLNIKGNYHLTKLRDTLLPKLISGELKIPEAEKIIQDHESIKEANYAN